MPEPIALTSRFRPKPGVLVRELDGETVLLDVATGRYFGLNATGARIFGRFDGVRDLATLLDELRREHAVDREQVRREVSDWLSEMLDEGLLAEVEPLL